MRSIAPHLIFLPGISPRIPATTGTSLAASSHGSPHSTVCHSPLPARPSHDASTRLSTALRADRRAAP